MIVIAIKKSLLRCITISLVILLGAGFYVFIADTGREKHHNGVLIHDHSILIDTYITTFLASSNTYENIEIFDIGKESVVKIVKVNDDAINEAKKCLNGITGIFVKVKAFPDKGYIVKVPFEPKIKVENPWLNDYGINSVDKIFIIFPDEEKPYLLVLDDRERPFFFTIDCNTDKLLESLNFVIDDPQDTFYRIIELYS